MSDSPRKLSDLTVPELYEAIGNAKGCGCCAYYDGIPDACPADEDGYVDHTYGDGCSRDFGSLLRALAAAARREVTA